MDVYLAWTQYGEDLIGIFTNEDDAEKILRVRCTNMQEHSHPDAYRCFVTKMEVE